MLILILIVFLILINSIDSYYNICNKRLISSIVSLASSRNSNDDSNVIFGGVKFSSPLSNHLRRLGITTALPIQESAIR
jgi:hypothetical protein